MIVVNFFSNPLMLAMKKTLDADALRQRVIANNIANVNTPGFKRSEVSFTDQLRSALGRKDIKLLTTHPRHFGAPVDIKDIRAKVVIDNNTSMRLSGNNVDIDQEMVNSAANEIHYQAVTDMLTGKYSGLIKVITGGRG